MAGADGALFLGTGNDGKVIKVDRERPGLGVLRQRRNGSARARAGAEWRAVRRHLARRPHLQASMRKARPRRSSIPTTSTSGRSPSIATATCSPAPATRARSTRSRPTARAQQFFATEDRRTPCRSRSIRTASCSSAPARRAACSASTRAGKGFLLLDTTYQEIRALRVDPKGVIYAAAQSGPRVRAAATASPKRRSAPPPVTPSIPNVSTEITSISVVDRRLGDRSPAHRRVRGSAQHHDRRGVSACSPTDCGTSCGSRATMRRTTSRSRPTARCWSPPARRASCFA